MLSREESILLGLQSVVVPWRWHRSVQMFGFYSVVASVGNCIKNVLVECVVCPEVTIIMRLTGLTLKFQNKVG